MSQQGKCLQANPAIHLIDRRGGEQVVKILLLTVEISCTKKIFLTLKHRVEQ